MGGALAGAFILAMAVIILRGPNLSGVGIGLRLTARFSYIFFWLAYVGAALTTLFGPLFGGIERRVRELGLAFAAAQLVHVDLVGWLAWLSQPESLTDAVMPFFAIAVVWTYLLAILSTDYAGQNVQPLHIEYLTGTGIRVYRPHVFYRFCVSTEIPSSIFNPLRSLLVSACIRAALARCGGSEKIL